MKAKIGLIMLTAMLVGAVVQADSVTHGGTTINMDFVNIGHAGNVGDTQDYGLNGGVRTFGAVNYNYRIGKFEVTADQWASVIAADSRVGNAGARSGSQPTGGATWFEAAKFSNWLTSGDAYNGAYQFDANGTLTGVDRDAALSTYGTVYVLPTEDEWHKAAYFKSDGTGYTLYATGNTTPVAGVDSSYGASNYSSPWDVGTGAVENNGTYDMGGNHWEWNESAYDSTLDNMTESRAIRGAAYSSLEVGLRSSYRLGRDPTSEDSPYNRFGFRVAAIPEPGVVGLMSLFGGGVVFIRRFFPAI
jgi:formylglycine-generating enzyme required for sulfatase activity